MFVHELNIRVRYAETDKMGYAYNGNYFTYYEVARTEALRKIGLDYKSLEDKGILLPVLENWSKYLIPAKYDENIKIKLRVPKLPSAKFEFEYEFFNSENILIHVGKTVLVFVESKSRKPTRPPEEVLNKLIPYFE